MCWRAMIVIHFNGKGVLEYARTKQLERAFVNFIKKHQLQYIFEIIQNGQR